tara:strand:- start:905 stop:1897 length:993 start_codon:yes stop_codon:yes gene_type:complete
MIPFTFIKDYCTKKFEGKYRLGSNGRQLIAESPFCENDWKRHFSLSLASGLWQCFKTGKKGNFIHLYSYLENIPYKKAYGEILFKELESEQENTFEEPPSIIYNNEEIRDELETNWIPLSPTTGLKTQDANILEGWNFIYKRHLFDLTGSGSQFYFAISGKYEGRIIIPYTESNETFFFQARSLYPSNVKYLSPSFPKSSDVLYPFDENSNYVVVCEGPLDALSLQLQGVNATSTQTSKISSEQTRRLREFGGEVIIGYDSDSAGKAGAEKFRMMAQKHFISFLSVIYPPKGFSDWNKAHVAGEDLKKHVTDNKKLFDFEYDVSTALTQL